MFIKSVTMSYNHWSYRLQHWVFPSLPRFYNFCPHFWMTILALIVTPFVSIFMGIAIPCNKLSKLVDDRMERSAMKELDKVSDEDLKLAILFSKRWYYLDSETISPCVYKQYRRIENLKGRTNGKYQRWYDLEQLCAPEDKMFSLRDILMTKVTEEVALSVPPAPPLRTRPWWSKAVTISKYVTGVILTPIILFVGYWLILAIGWCWYYMVRWDWITIVVGTVFVVVCVGIIILVWWLGIKFMERVPPFSFPRCIVCQNLKKSIKFLFRGIGMIFVFFWEGIKAFKSSNCPEIKWKD